MIENPVTFQRFSGAIVSLLRQAFLQIVLGLVAVWRYAFSPLFGDHCRFAPSCSHYATSALNKHGLVRGSILAGARLLRCHPWSRHSGIDPVPD